MPPMSAGKADLLDLYYWCTEFDEVREPIQGYNQPYIRTLADINPVTDDISLFTDADDPDQMPNTEAETILSFCRNVRSSDAFYKNPPEKLVAVLHESDSAGRSRETDYPMVATQLYEALLVPRLGSKTLSSTDDAISPQDGTLPDKRSPEEPASNSPARDTPNAERRLVFVANLDEWVVWALAATASHIEARAIRSFISDHLVWKADLNVNIPNSLPRTFEMAFHLPFYALRDNSKGGPFHNLSHLRNCQNIDFMQWTDQSNAGPSLSEYLYQVEASCLVTGQDSHIWSAYIFIDSCNEYVDGGVLEDYEAQKKELGSVYDMLDPVTGKPLAWPSITPRELYLRVLQSCLDECTSAWDTFTAGDLRYFVASGKDCNMTPIQSHQMVAITKSFNQMAMLSRKLNTVNVGLKNTMIELNHHLAYENNESAILQMATAKDVKILTWVTFHSLPFMLVAGFMSTRAEILPLPETPATLVVSLVTIEAVIWIMLDRFANGKYTAMVKNAVCALFHWARRIIRYKDDGISTEQA
ncbi:hypothetical protein PG985_010354 [Apiospora marii]|uniref:uncharacterized protein n=1 Tax=Apiospora marii TaxID=335849 RepID=UPI00312F24A0